MALTPEMQRSTRRRVARRPNPRFRQRLATATALLVAFSFAAQSAGLPLLTSAAAAECCCAHRAAHCRCKVCEHARELASGQPCLKSCGASTQDTAVIAHLDPAIPATALTAPATALALVEVRIAAPPLDPPFEVPTPPPLAAS
jgi:hypothetical protein